FQAEDGIRDRNVTGVQTCALPILAPVPRDFQLISADRRVFSCDENIFVIEWIKSWKHGKMQKRIPGVKDSICLVFFTFESTKERSEERRVGNECRCRCRQCCQRQK